jgi:UPF0755 protein
MAKSKTGSKGKKIIITLGIVIILSLLGVGYSFYTKVFFPNISLIQQKEKYIYIPTGSSFTDVLRILNDQNLLENQASFEWVAEQMKYKNKVKAGRYRIKDNMSNKELVALLRSGEQTPINVVFNNVRTAEQLASVIASQLEADSAAFMGLLGNETFLKKYGFTTPTRMAMFIPNTYEFYWNTSSKMFIERMANEYKKFWNSGRKARAAKLNLTQTQVSVLASIVDQETSKNDEKPRIAGVYMNRYLKGWKLEADPTLIFAAGDFTIRRVLNIHKEIDSPYNTYLYTGLPPGPICIPSITAIDAVLNYEKHEYMFFCAKEDFSGYHSFAKNYSDHLLNARRFQNELNRRKIKS